jgi:Ca2+-binding EF-hand superfamily protein
MPTAIQISGRAGRHALINDTYEPMQIQHNDKPCWVARDVAPRYLFHSGKARWCISKQIDDGARCWAYIQDPGNTADPAACPGAWNCCSEDNSWAEDANVKAVAVPASQDKFVQLRMSLDADMRQYGLIEVNSLKALWKRLDFNGNNIVSLAEIDKLAVEMTNGGGWPEWLNSKPALMRAYKKTTLLDGNGDDWVQKPEFHALLLNMFWFGKLFQIFDNMNGDDRRMDINEFKAGLSQIGVSLSDSEATDEFKKIDANGGGQVLFVEFCAYIRHRVNPDANANFDADVMSGEHCGKVIRAHHGNKATHSHVVSKKCMKDFDDLEVQIKKIMEDHKELHKLWKCMDYNGNNICSLAEIDKMVVEKYAVLNHKPALMRAYKRAIKEEDKNDGWVHKKAFKSLLGYLFYFNKIYWIFDEVNGDDRRMTFPEFKKCLTLAGVQMSESDAKKEFSSIDKNGGGMVLFDEFCAWFASKSCPACLTELVG